MATTTAQKTEHACHNKSVEAAKFIIEQMGGVWSDDGCVYIFPDSSTGAFTDIRNGAQQKTSTGEIILHFAAAH